jgi:hypothetical protein
MRATLPSINVPVLTVVGDRDTMTLPEAGQFITQSVPMGELTTLAPARHMGLIEHHHLFNQVVAKSVDSCRAASVAGECEAVEENAMFRLVGPSTRLPQDQDDFVAAEPAFVVICSEKSFFRNSPSRSLLDPLVIS